MNIPSYVTGFHNDTEKKFMYGMGKVLPADGIMVEIGAFKGLSTWCFGSGILEGNKTGKLYSVDNFIGVKGDVITLEMYNENIGDLLKAGLNHSLIYDNSAKAASCPLFPNESVDFCFIDACHEKQAVLQDIHAWWPKVKKNRSIAGHDYRRSEQGMVYDAVNEYFKNIKMNISIVKGTSIWFVMKG